MSKTPSSPRPSPPVCGHQPRHLSPQPSAGATVAKTSHQCVVERRGGENPRHNQTAAKKKKKEIPSETDSLNGCGKPQTGRSATPAKTAARREGCRGRAETPAGSLGSPRARIVPPPTKTQSSAANNTCGLLLGLPGAGAARLAASLPRAASPPLLARAVPSSLPERGGRMRSLGEKNVSARTIPFSPPAARGGRGLAFFSLALPRAPRLSRPVFPSQQPLRAPSVAIIHGPPGDRR